MNPLIPMNLKKSTMSLVLLLMTVLGFENVAFADDMDFGNLEAEQVKKGALPLEAEKPLEVIPTYSLDPEAPATTAVNTTAISTGKSKWSEIKRNMGAGFFQYATVVASEVNRGKGNLDTYNYLTLEYRTGKGEKVFFRPAFLFQSSGQDLRGTNMPSKFAWSDVYLGYSSYSIPWLPFNMDYKTEVRLYLPTSETSQNEGMIARLRGDLKAHYPLSNRLTFLLWFKPDYFFQRRTVKMSTNGNFVNGTRDYGYELSANLFYLFRGGVFGYGGSIGHEQSWSHESVVERVSVFRREDVSIQAFVGVNAFGFLTHIGVDQTRNVSRPSGPLVGLTDTETQYFARTYYRF